MTDQRIKTRRRTLKGGTISFSSGTFQCVIRNLSDTGACLEMSGPQNLPDHFKLLIKPEDITRNCHVQWRSLEKIGVNFY